MPDSPQLPARFLARLARIVPPERLAATVGSFGAAQAVGLRVNTLRTQSEEATVQALQEAGLHPRPVPWLPHAYVLPADERSLLQESAPYQAGEVYLQNISSQVPPVLLDPQPGERVLDLCAAPGSKTGQIAAMMGNEGELAAVEIVKDRFFRLRANLEAQGAAGVRTFLRAGETVWRHRPDHFDRVLVDVPCSTEGRFRAGDEETYRYWSERKIREMARKQQRLLHSAVLSTRPGGVVVYSTCTFAPEENEAVLDRVLADFGDAVEIEPVVIPVENAVPGLAQWEEKTFREDMSRARRILPDGEMEAFFVARLRKLESTG
jgi:NOL1/NOP2/sun family putative RNA methylase